MEKKVTPRLVWRVCWIEKKRDLGILPSEHTAIFLAPGPVIGHHFQCYCYNFQPTWHFCSLSLLPPAYICVLAQHKNLSGRLMKLSQFLKKENTIKKKILEKSIWVLFPVSKKQLKKLFHSLIEARGDYDVHPRLLVRKKDNRFEYCWSRQVLLFCLKYSLFEQECAGRYYKDALAKYCF